MTRPGTCLVLVTAWLLATTPAVAEDLPPLVDISVTSTLDRSPQPSRIWNPRRATTRPTPLLVFLHSWSGDYTQDNSAWLKQAVSRGWIFLRPKYRGGNAQPAA